MEHISIRQATPGDSETVLAMLHEAARWLEDTGRGMWREEEIEPVRIGHEVDNAQFYIALISGEPAGCFRLDAEDPLFWPESAPGEALYLHRLAVFRRFAGHFVSDLLLTSAKMLTRQQHRNFLRLDCEVGRERLYALYARNGFTAHSEKLAPPFHVMRWECRIAPP